MSKENLDTGMSKEIFVKKLCDYLAPKGKLESKNSEFTIKGLCNQFKITQKTTERVVEVLEELNLLSEYAKNTYSVMMAFSERYSLTPKELMKEIKNALYFPIELRTDAEEIIRSAQIEALFTQEMPLFQSLGIGIHDDTFYFGTKLNKGDTLFDGIVTSDRKVYRNLGKDGDEIKAGFGLHYRFPFFHDVLDNKWSRTGKFGQYNWIQDNVPEITHEQIFKMVLDLVKWKYWHPKNTTYKFLALDIMATYLLPIWEAKGRILIYGESGWGKTRLSQIYSKLAFNSMLSVDSSDSSIFRIIESTKATVIVDNHEELDEVKAAKTIHLFQTGYKKGQKVVRTDTNRSFIPVGFDIYASMVLNTITPIDEVSENRSHITRTVRTDDPKYNKMEAKSPRWDLAVDKLHVYALQNFKGIMKEYEESKENKIVSRDSEIYLPVLVLAKLISKKLYEEMYAFCLKSVEDRAIKDYADDWVYISYQYIKDLFYNGTDKVEFLIKDITDKLGSEIFDEEDKRFKGKIRTFQIRVGKKLTANALFERKLLHGRTHYLINEKNFEKSCKMLGFTDLLEGNMENEGDLLGKVDPKSDSSGFREGKWEKGVDQVDQVDQKPYPKISTQSVLNHLSRFDPMTKKDLAKKCGVKINDEKFQKIYDNLLTYGDITEPREGTVIRSDK